MALLTLIFLGILFIASDTVYLARNFVILIGAFIAFMITYFTTLTMGLVVSAVLVLLIGAYSAYYALKTGGTVPLSTFFWVPWIPLTALAISRFTRQIVTLQRRNDTLSTQLEQLAIIDESTQLKNIRAFENDASVYMKIARRYNMSLVLATWQFRYPHEVSEVFVGEQFVSCVRRISETIGAKLRTEDAVYLVSQDPYQWVILLFANPASYDIVFNRIQRSLLEIDFTDIIPVRVSLEFDSYYAIYDNSDMTPLSFLASSRLTPSSLNIREGLESGTPVSEQTPKASEAVPMKVHPITAALMKYDSENGSELVKTLYEFINSGKDSVATAEKLGVSEDELNVRLDAIYGIMSTVWSGTSGSENKQDFMESLKRAAVR